LIAFDALTCRRRTGPISSPGGGIVMNMRKYMPATLVLVILSSVAVSFGWGRASNQKEKAPKAAPAPAREVPHPGSAEKLRYPELPLEQPPRTKAPPRDGEPTGGELSRRPFGSAEKITAPELPPERSPNPASPRETESTPDGRLHSNTSSRRRLKRSPLAKSPAKPQERQESSGQDIGYITADFTFNPDLYTPFNIDVFLQPYDPSFSGSANVYMEETNKVLYEPREFTLATGQRQTVKATVVKSKSGLGEIMATADRWKTLREPIYLGFRGKITAKSLEQPLRSGEVKSVSLEFVDDSGRPTPLDASVTLILRSTKTSIRIGPSGEWSDHLDLTIERGTTAILPFELKPTTWWADEGLLSVEVKLRDNFVAFNQNLTFPILLRWYLQLMMAILGASLYSWYKGFAHMTSSSGSWIRKTLSVLGFGLIGGASAGGLAFLLASWNIIGIKVDTTSPLGFVILGVLFSYIGVDLILKKALPLLNQGSERNGRPDKTAIGPAKPFLVEDESVRVLGPTA
jgi:hypothetical protein